MDEADRAALRATGRVLPAALTGLTAPGCPPGPAVPDGWAAADGAGWRYFATLDEACEFAGRIARQARRETSREPSV